MILFLFTTLFSSLSQANNCPQTTLTKLKGLKTRVLELPGESQLLSSSNEKVYLVINKKHELILSNQGRQIIVTDLKETQLQRPAYFVEIEWYGDLNEDCRADLLIWKKPGIFLGETTTQPVHGSYNNEKIQIESILNEKYSYKIQSLGIY